MQSLISIYFVLIFICCFYFFFINYCFFFFLKTKLFLVFVFTCFSPQSLFSDTFCSCTSDCKLTNWDPEPCPAPPGGGVPRAFRLKGDLRKSRDVFWDAAL